MKSGRNVKNCYHRFSLIVRGIGIKFRSYLETFHEKTKDGEKHGDQQILNSTP